MQEGQAAAGMPGEERHSVSIKPVEKKNIAGNIFLAENIQSWKQSTDSQGENAKLTEPALPLPGTPASCLLWEQPDKDINQAACTASPNTGHHMSACQLISVGFTSATDPRISWK